jgi:hypothetical protein
LAPSVARGHCGALLCRRGVRRYTHEMEHKDRPPNLLAAPPRVVNIGLELFAHDLKAVGAQVVHVQWSPPAGGNARLAGLLEKLQKR